ncbi:hypothetical protein PIB30_010621 [Stylosanthes scabra]|uniref:Uncharacterized protein n=1 Tax=Stylosanthes scabra TaxID=79078 RepID=A0ABU6U712_9FABA|nr:hypothetical protein [Stylosanthes scabra]
MSTRKRKNLEPKYGSIFSNEFDHVRFAQEYLLGENNQVSMEGDHFEKNREYVTKFCIKTAAICQAARNKLKGDVVVLDGEVNQLRTRNASLEAEKRVVDMEKFTLSGKVTELKVRLALSAKEVEDLKENMKKLEEDRLSEYEKHKVVASKLFTLIEEHKRILEAQRKLQRNCNNLRKREFKSLKMLWTPDYRVVDGKVVDENGAEVISKPNTVMTKHEDEGPKSDAKEN